MHSLCYCCSHLSSSQDDCVSISDNRTLEYMLRLPSNCIKLIMFIPSFCLFRNCQEVETQRQNDAKSDFPKISAFSLENFSFQ